MLNNAPEEISDRIFFKNVEYRTKYLQLRFGFLMIMSLVHAESVKSEVLLNDQV